MGLVLAIGETEKEILRDTGAGWEVVKVCGRGHFIAF